jgi:hypothetical protein
MELEQPAPAKTPRHSWARSVPKDLKQQDVYGLTLSNENGPSLVTSDRPVAEDSASRCSTVTQI